MNQVSRNSSFVLSSITFILLLISCNTGLEPSPEPGLLRVILHQAPGDTSIVVARDTIYSRNGDSLQTSIFQGRAYIDTIWATLYEDTTEVLARDHEYNLLDKGDGDFKKFVIFQTLLPPGKYTKLQFGITAERMLLTYGYAYGGVRIPMEHSPNADLIQEFQKDYAIESGRVTEIEVQIKAFDSVNRFKDLFYFNPQLEVVDIRDAGTFTNHFRVKYSE